MIEAEILIDGESTGDTWKWKDEEDFLTFLLLMHNQWVVDKYRDVRPTQFTATYVDPMSTCYGFEGRATKIYHYTIIKNDSEGSD